MTPTLIISEIESQYANEWVLVQDPQTNAAHAVQSGQVFCHSKDRDEAYRQAVALRCVPHVSPFSSQARFRQTRRRCGSQAFGCTGMSLFE
jgi:hypothetical protein